MKKLAIAITAVAAFTGSAVAADLPVKARYIAPAPVVTAYNWTGCYVGAGGGYGMYNQDISREVDTAGNTIFNGLVSADGSDSLTLGGRGWFGTVQVGCDYQMTPSFVIGAFGDYDFGSIKGHMGFGSDDEKLSSSWDVGGRVGWIALPNLLAYVSGGYTQARFDEMNFAFGGISTSVPATTYSGWFLGSGYEYGLGFMPGLFWKTEYRFADYQAQTLQMDFTAGLVGTVGTFDSHKYVQTIRSELVYRFNWH
jgi:outer membrane immunogenic protein